MELIEDKKQRLAKLVGISKLSKGKKIVPQKQKDGTYKLSKNVVTAPYVGPLALGKVLRISGLTDIVALRWNEGCGCYDVTMDENCTDGTIIEFLLIYGKDKD